MDKAFESTKQEFADDEDDSWTTVDMPNVNNNLLGIRRGELRVVG